MGLSISHGVFILSPAEISHFQGLNLNCSTAETALGEARRGETEIGPGSVKQVQYKGSMRTEKVSRNNSAPDSASDHEYLVTQSPFDLHMVHLIAIYHSQIGV